MEIKECVLGLNKADLISFYNRVGVKPTYLPEGSLYSTDVISFIGSNSYVKAMKGIDLTALPLYSLTRPSCENNFEYVQLIPYLILFYTTDEGETTKYLAYKRGESGNESRLHNLYSIGLGGHIDTGIKHKQQVVPYGNSDSYVIWDLLQQQITKELHEEIGLRPEILDEYPIDTCFDVTNVSAFYLDDDDVSAVHLCVPIFLNIGPLVLEGKINNLTLEDDVIKDISANSKAALTRMELEPWSRIMLNYLRD